MSIASIMMGGMPIEKFDDMPKSAISELGNMIMGNTATILFTKGIGIEITPPSLLMGEKITVSQSSMKTICVPLNLGNDGKVTIDISLEKN